MVSRQIREHSDGERSSARAAQAAQYNTADRRKKLHGFPSSTEVLESAQPSSADRGRGNMRNLPTTTCRAISKREPKLMEKPASCDAETRVDLPASNDPETPVPRSKTTPA